MMRPTRLMLLSLLASGLGATPAITAENGGTVSVFAEPAGPRPIGMGGGYTAVGDDATAWIWNPATLAYVRRGEFLVGYTTPDVLDYREQLASFALPNWRWGTFGVTWRQFGIDGLDVRDARNVLLAENQTDRQSEIALGYARTMGEAWGIGVSTRWRRLELMGRSANALGADAGVVLRPAALTSSTPSWLDDLTLGFSVQNLVRPSVRLDIEEVPDPRSARAGMAWRPFQGGIPVLLAMDLQQTEGRSLSLHAGAEVALHPSFDVRVGMNQTSLTAGTGLRRGNLSVDYAFQDGPITAAQHVGISYRFGATVAAARAAAERTREEEIQNRLNEAFEARRQERIGSLLDQATRARQQGDPEAALERLAALRALEPDHPSAAALEAACYVDRARQIEATGDSANAAVLFARALALAPDDQLAAEGVKRCRSVGDRRAARTAEIRRMFGQALEAFANDDLAAARRGFRGILDVSPDDAEAKSMLERTERAISRRTAQMLDQAERFSEAGLVGAALESIERARKLDPQSPRIARLEATLAASSRSRVPPGTAGDSVRTVAVGADRRSKLSLQEQREVSEYYQRGLASLQRGAHGDAVRLLELVWSKDPSYGEVAAVLKREYQTRGMDAFAASRFEEAIVQWENGLRVAPDDERMRAYLSRARTYLARSQELSGP